MRTNIILDDDLIQRVRQLTGVKTKREVVHETLRTLIQLYEQAEVCKETDDRRRTTVDDLRSAVCGLSSMS